MANYFKEAYDKLMTLIREDSNFERMIDRRRMFLRNELRSKDFAFNDGIMITPLTDELVEMRTPGREDQYTLRLIYFRKILPEINFDILTEQAENLIELLRDNQYRSSIEQLNETDFYSKAKWAVTGDASFSGGEGSQAVSFTFAGGSLNGTLSQTAANRAKEARNSKDYRLQYTISVTTAPDGDFSLKLNKFGEDIEDLKFTAGVHALDFTSQSDAKDTDFVITAAETTATQGLFTIDDISLRELINEWHFIASQSVDYSIDLPADMADKNYFGFAMTIVIWKSKYD